MKRSLLVRVGASLFVVSAAVVAAGVTGAGMALAAPAQPASTPAALPGVTILQTRSWSPDGKVPTGTIWRTFETWQTDVARTDKGDLVRVDPLTPRGGQGNQGLVRLRLNRPGYELPASTKLELYPAKQVHGSPYPPARWQAADFDDSTWTRDPYPQRTLYGLVALRCLRGKFEVTAPAGAGDLDLTVRFRGGAIAYVNGQEVGRAFLPAGEIKPDTLAEDYSKEAYIGPDGVLIEQGLIWLGGYQKNEWSEFADKMMLIESGPHGYRQLLRWRSIGADAACPLYFGAKSADVVTRYKSRCRTLEAKVPAALLRKGANVLAIGIHRAPAWEGMFTSPSYGEGGRKSLVAVNSGATFWDRSELEDARLAVVGPEPARAAVVPNVTPPKGLRAWNHPACVEIDPAYYGDPNEPLRPVRLRGARNGTYSGALIVSSSGPIRGLRAEVTDLKGPAGALPAAAIQVAYPCVSDGVVGGKRPPPFASMNSYPVSWPIYDILEPTAPKEIARSPWDFGRTFPPLQPVWFTVRLPRDARAGEYRGAITVNVDGEPPATTELVVEVAGEWVVPDAKDFIPIVSFFECPDAVAKQYKVNLWSEEHWKLLDKVFEVLGQVGTKDVYIPLAAKTHLGNPYSMVRWVKQAEGSYQADTTIAERYLDLAVKHLGKIPIVCLYVSTRSQYDPAVSRSRNEPDQPIVTELVPATGELKELLPPKWGTPEARAFWKPVIDKLRAALAQRGLDNSMHFGYMADGPGRADKGDMWGLPNHMADLRAIAPQTKWMASSHFPAGSWKAGTLTAKDFLGVLSYVRALAMSVNWMDDNDNAMFPPAYGWLDRPGQTLSLVGSRSRGPELTNDHCPNVMRWRIALEALLLSRPAYPGCGPWGADFWANECEAFDSYHNVALSENPVRWMVGAGTAGPLPTCRTRMLQEGLQEAEARIFVQNALLDAGKKAKLAPDLAKRCEELCAERTRALSYISYFRYNDAAECMPRARLIPDVAAWEDASAKLYRLADEVAKAMK